MDRYLLQAKTGEQIAPKTIYMVRHGQSIHNAQVYADQGVDQNDERYVDACLTPLGVQQARDIARDVRALRPQLVVSSPMTRAIQTAAYATAAANIPVAISELCTERLGCSCDIGSPVPVLQNRFPHLDFSAIARPDAWWWTVHNLDKPPTKPSDSNWVRSLELMQKYDVTEPYAALMKRVNAFRLWLLQRPESRIVVFAHGVFLRHLASDGLYFSNCEIRKLTV